MKKVFQACILFIIGIALVFGVVFAQTRETGVIEGKVVDEQGLPLPGVIITASSPSLMGIRSVITDKEGKYRIPVLPTGNYTIEVSLEGFAPIKKTDILVHASATVTLNIELKMEKLKEEIVVTASIPVVDKKEASVGKTFITRDILENLPTHRNVSQIFVLSPGSTDEYLSESYVHGGSRLSNSYQIDGVELTDSWGGSGTYTAPIDYDVIEETQILGLGAPAEYGNFTGAVANIITKSGGNNFSGDINFFYQAMEMQSSANIDEDDTYWSLIPESPLTRLVDPSFHLGGPIIKDKLWFYGGFEYYSTKDRLETTGKVRTITFPKVFIKLTFQPDKKNRFQGFFQYHDRTAKHNQLSALYHDEANQDLLYPVHAWNISYLHTFSSKSIFEAKFTGYTMTWDSIPSSRDRNIAGHVDLITGEYTENLYFWSHWWSERIGGKLSFSTYVDNFITGSHDYKFGFEFERSPGGGSYDFNGPDKVVYYDLNGQPYQAMKTTYNQDAVIVRYSFYAQDSWSITDSFVLNPGIRFNIYRGSVPPLEQADKTVYTPEGFEPRIGFVWDIFKNQKTLLKAHYGRYFEGTKTYNFSQLTPMSDTIYYSVGPNWSTLTELYTIPGQDLYSIDPNIKHPSSDQIVAGIEHVFTKDLSASISFVYKDFNNFIDPVNVGGIFDPESYTDSETGQVYTIYNQLNPGEDHYYITNPEKGKDIGAAYPDIVSFTPDRKYKAVEFILTKRLSHNWQLYASYTYSKEKGNYSSENIPGMEQTFLDPNYQINNEGSFRSSIPHIFKVQATWILPLNFSLSAFYKYYSGRPWTRQLVITGLNQGSVTILAEPAGSRRMKDTNELDLRVGKSFYFKNFRLSLSLDIFNLFNQVRETEVFSRSGENFGKPLLVNSPRSFRLGAKLYF